ncbi:MAG: multidrug effflux MFS transporter [Kineosporiaceae bacterium]
MPSSLATLPAVPSPRSQRREAPARWSRIGPPQLLLLGTVTAVGPLTIDLYLPALPAMAAEFAVEPAALQLSLTATVLGLALGQLVLGPVSDRLGRRAPLVGGLAAYAAVTVALAFAGSLPALVAGRFVQGFLAAAALVVTRAVLRDHVSGPALGRALAGLVLVMGAGPILAPALGSLLLQVTGWRGVFVALAVLGAATAAAVAVAMPESLPRHRRVAVPVPRLARGYAALAVDRSFAAPALASALSFAALFAYISAGSFLLQGRYGLSETGYGLVFAVTAACVIGGSQVGSRLIERVGAVPLLRAVPVAGAVIAGALVAVTLLGAAELPVLVGLLMAACAVAGVAMPVGATVALTGQPPQRAGSASGLLGVVQFAVGGLAAPVVGLLGTGSPLGMALVMLLAFVLSALAGRLSRESGPSGIMSGVTRPGARGRPVPPGLPRLGGLGGRSGGPP